MKPSSGLTRLQRVSESKLRFARALRREMTPAERLLWEHVRNRRCGGFKIRRQQVVKGFVADFYCESAKLAIEVDGDVHDDTEQRKTDFHRGKVFKTHGIKTIRFENENVLLHITDVLKKIQFVCKQRSLRRLTSSFLPQEGGNEIHFVKNEDSESL